MSNPRRHEELTVWIFGQWEAAVFIAVTIGMVMVAVAMWLA
jgi:hypothetical protein